jgi:hypothetical protein
MAYRLTGRARRDVLNIGRRIAADSEPAADRFIDRSRSISGYWEKRPLPDVSVMTLHPGYRSFPVGG